jgi:hypothetical protein
VTQAWGEHDRQECKAGFDGGALDKARLVKELVAFANAGGGSIAYGVDDRGQVIGLDVRAQKLLDPANVGNFLEAYLGQQRLPVTVEYHREAQAVVVVVQVAAHPRPPVVFERDGTYSDNGQQKFLFRPGDVFTRASTKACPARSADFDRWLTEAERRGERRMIEMMEVVANRAPGYEVQVGPPDTEAGRLTAAVQAYGADPTKLLDGDELLQVSLDDEAVALVASDLAVRELVFQSALRKRATLWWWLAEMNPEASWIQQQLLVVPDARDRDVSDSGRAVLEVAATGCPGLFDQLQQTLQGSTKYKHFRDAGEGYPTRETALNALRGRIARVEGASRLEVRDAIRAMVEGDGPRRGSLPLLTALSLRRWAEVCADGGRGWTL